MTATTTPRPRVEREPDEALDLDNRFADNLYARRNALGITRARLAQLTGISRYAIEHLERGNGRPGPRRRVTIGEAFVLAEALDVQPGDLLKAVGR